MIKKGLIAFLIITLSACSNVGVDNDELVNALFASVRISADITGHDDHHKGDKEKQEVFITSKKSELLASIKKKGSHYALKIKGKHTLFSKKQFNIFPVADSSEFIAYAQENLFQDAVEGHDLIGLKSKFVNVQSESNKLMWFFQEEVGDMLLEKRRRKDGIVFTYKKQVEVIHLPQHDKKSATKAKAKSIIETKLQQWKSKELGTEQVFDVEKCGDFLAIKLGFQLGNQRVAYYLNPASNLIEVFSFYAEKDQDQLLELVISDKMVNEQVGHFHELERAKGKGSRIVECYKLEKFMPVLSWNKVTSNQDTAIVREPLIDDRLQVVKDVASITLRFRTQHIILTKPLVVPRGFLLVINKGQTIDMQQGASILSYSPVSIVGNATSPVKIFSSDATGQGFHVVKAKGSSEIKFVEFDNLNSLTSGSWRLSGSITFYKSPVKIESCQFLSTKSEDVLNFTKADFSLVDSKIISCASDALDADFCSGIIKNCTFEQIGNDAIDGSESVIKITNTVIDGVEDKAISGGEESKFVVENCTIQNASLGIVAKDLSEIIITDVTINKVEVVFVAFQKKLGFGAARIDVKNVACKEFKELYLIQEESIVTVNGTKIQQSRNDVKKYLYGNEYGKKTKRD